MALLAFRLLTAAFGGKYLLLCAAAQWLGSVYPQFLVTHEHH